MNPVEIINAGLQAMASTSEVKLDVHEAQSVCALAWAAKHGGFDGKLTDEQLNWVIAAVRAAYVAGRERRLLFKGYG